MGGEFLKSLLQSIFPNHKAEFLILYMILSWWKPRVPEIPPTAVAVAESMATMFWVPPWSSL